MLNPSPPSGWRPRRSARRECFRTLRILHTRSVVAATVAAGVVAVEAVSPKGRHRLFAHVRAGVRSPGGRMGTACAFRAEEPRTGTPHPSIDLSLVRPPLRNTNE